MANQHHYGGTVIDYLIKGGRCAALRGLSAGQARPKLEAICTTTTAPTIVEIKDGVVTALDFATFITETEKYPVNLSMLNGSTAYVDTVVVNASGTRTASAANYLTAKTAIDNLTTAQATITALAFNTDEGATNTDLQAAIQTQVRATVDAANVELVSATYTKVSTNLAAGDNLTAYTIKVSKNGYTRTMTVSGLTIVLS